MPISRRHFLRAGSVVMIAAGAPISLNALGAERRADHNGLPGQSSDTPALMSKAMFAAHLNTVFRVRLNARQEVQVELIELNDCGPTEPAAAQACRECL